MSPSTCLEIDAPGKYVDYKLYRGMVFPLFYLIASRLDIIYIVYKCAIFQATSNA